MKKILTIVLFFTLIVGCIDRDSQNILNTVGQIYEHSEITKPTAEVLELIKFTNPSLSDESLLYFDKYIDADGIAVIGNSVLSDDFFIDTRETILLMTSKRPQLRKYFRGKFYIAIAPYLSHLPQVDNTSFGGFVNTAKWKLDKSNNPIFYGYTLNTVGSGLFSTEIIVHEFAHAIEDYVRKYFDPDFTEKIKNAHTNARKQNLWRWLKKYKDYDHHHYFTSLLDIWFFHTGNHDYAEWETPLELIDIDPMGFELITEWFSWFAFGEMFQYTD